MMKYTTHLTYELTECIFRKYIFIYFFYWSIKWIFSGTGHVSKGPQQVVMRQRLWGPVVTMTTPPWSGKTIRVRRERSLCAGEIMVGYGGGYIVKILAVTGIKSVKLFVLKINFWFNFANMKNNHWIYCRKSFLSSSVIILNCYNSK